MIVNRARKKKNRNASNKFTALQKKTSQQQSEKERESESREEEIGKIAINKDCLVCFHEQR